MTHYNLVHTFVRLPQAMKFLTAVDEECEKLETIPHESQEYEGGYSGSTQRQKKRSMDTCHLKNADLEPILQKIQRKSRAPW